MLEVGDYCVNEPESPRCPVETLCFKGVCSALCVDSREDCNGSSEQVCAVAEIPFDLDGDTTVEQTLPLQVCETYEVVGSGACKTTSDCKGISSICGPIQRKAKSDYPIPYDIETVCRTMNPALRLAGESCGLNPGEGECAVGFCSLSTDPGVGNRCADLCTSNADCSTPMVVDGVSRPTFCRASLYGWNDSLQPDDDLYVSTCWPAPLGSTLVPCDPLQGCANDEVEVCAPSLKAFSPIQDSVVEWVCMAREGVEGEPLLELGEPCESDPSCLSGRCRPGPSGGYCSRSCDSDLECLDGGPTMVCVDYEPIPRLLGSGAVVRECRKQETCSPCAHDNDCFNGMHCVQVGGPSSDATVCAYPCEVDEECDDKDGGFLCRNGLSVEGEPLTTCAPNSCNQERK